MYTVSLIGLLSLVLTLLPPVLLIFITVWVYKMKKNSDKMVSTQEEIAELLKKG